MKEKVKAKDWYIAITHWLTAGFAIPLLMSFLLAIPVAIIFGGNLLVMQIAQMTVWLVSIWLGAIYSSKWISKRYIIADSQKIARFAAIFVAILGGLYRVYNIMSHISQGTFSAYKAPLAIDVVFFAAGVYIFFVISKKYIQNTTETPTVTPTPPPMQ